jgi:hypothetical protein
MLDELRLAHLVGLNALMLGVCVWTARRFSRDRFQNVSDALLLWYAVQYVAIGAPGMAGMLNASSATFTAVALLALLWLATRGLEPPADADEYVAALDRWAPRICALFVPIYIAVRTWDEAYSAVMATDSLIYHFPAAVDWLQSGRMGLHETWFHNPANTYSPLAGSIFIAWLVAPMGNDVAARFAQAPALVLLHFGVQQLLRSLGVRRSPAAICAATAACSRSFFNQAFIGKDDVFVAAFFIAIAAAAAHERLRDRFGPWRVGLALGLLMATKYTVALSLPALMLLCDAPFRAAWSARRWSAAACCAAVLGGPWYVRNAWLTGNPIFPINVTLFGHDVFHGLFSTAVAPELRQWVGVFNVISNPSFGLSWALTIVLGAAWLGAAAFVGRRVLTDSLPRLCVAGPLAGFAAFVWKSPYAEFRFVYPSLALLFACLALTAAQLRRPFAQSAALLIVLGCFISTSAEANASLPLLAIAAAATAPLVALLLVCQRAPRLGRRLSLAAALAGVLTLTATAYIGWYPYLRQYQVARQVFWQHFYHELGDAWTFVGDELPAKAPLAYANTPVVYPLYDFELGRPVFYVPTSRDVDTIADLPPSTRRLAKDEIANYAVAATDAGADQRRWLDRLRESRAAYVFICKTGSATQPPELAFAANDAARFVRIFENEAAVVYEVSGEW